MAFALGNHPINETSLNVQFGDVLHMSDDEFDDWVERVRNFLAEKWREEGIPPHNGTSLQEIERDMRSLASVSTNSFLRQDSLTGTTDIIVPKGRSGSSLRSLFTNMGKSADGNAVNASIYEHLIADPTTERGASLIERWKRSLARAVRRDSMYSFSSTLKPGEDCPTDKLSGIRWISGRPCDSAETYWVQASDEVADGSEITLTRSDAYRLARLGRIPAASIPLAADMNAADAAKTLLGVEPGCAVFPWLTKGHFRIRPYENKRVFPSIFSMLRLGLVMQGGNFPAQIAKFLYMRYGELACPGTDPLTVFDPSMGYGGRCLGALAAAAHRPIHYVGTDPNTDNWIDPSYSRYEYLADFYRATVGQPHHATIEPYCCGSEVVHLNEGFQRLRGRVNLAFTSPPYFCAEIYSREPTQSAIKFPTYPEWRDGFLQQTLSTCVDWLKPGGYLLWNIADVQVKGSYVPLEHDSLAILAERGMTLVEKLKMPLATAPGGGQLLNGTPTTKNFLKLNGTFRKYEPIYVFCKPSTI